MTTFLSGRRRSRVLRESVAGLVEAIARRFRAAERRRKHRRSVHQFGALTDRQLRDIGIGRRDMIWAGRGPRIRRVRDGS